MTEFQQLQNDFTKNGWTSRQGRGDHLYFSKPGVSSTEIMVSRSISGWRNVQNVIARVRRVEPDFKYSKNSYTAPKKKDTPEASATATPEVKVKYLPTGFPRSRKDIRTSFKWIHTGLTVRYSAITDWDFSQIDNPESAINRPYIIESITPKKKLILKDTLSETRIEAFGNEVDTMETFVCGNCGKKLPTSYMSRTGGYTGMCCECVHEIKENKKKEDMKAKLRTNEDIIIDAMAKIGKETDNKALQRIIDGMNFSVEDKGGLYVITLVFVNSILPEQKKREISNILCFELKKELAEYMELFAITTNFTSKTEVVEVKEPEKKTFEKPEIKDEPEVEESLKSSPEIESINLENNGLEGDVLTESEERELLIDDLKRIVGRLRELSVTVKIKKIKYEEKQAVMVYKKVKKSFSI